MNERKSFWYWVACAPLIALGGLVLLGPVVAFVRAVQEAPLLTIGGLILGLWVVWGFLYIYTDTMNRDS